MPTRTITIALPSSARSSPPVVFQAIVLLQPGRTPRETPPSSSFGTLRDQSNATRPRHGIKGWRSLGGTHTRSSGDALFRKFCAARCSLLETRRAHPPLRADCPCAAAPSTANGLVWRPVAAARAERESTRSLGRGKGRRNGVSHKVIVGRLDFCRSVAFALPKKKKKTTPLNPKSASRTYPAVGFRDGGGWRARICAFSFFGVSLGAWDSRHASYAWIQVSRYRALHAHVHSCQGDETTLAPFRQAAIDRQQFQR